MKKLLAGMFVGCFALAGCGHRDQPKPEKVAQQEEAAPTPVSVKKEITPRKEMPLSFWCGEIIVGEGEHANELELVAAPGKKAVLLTADEGGLFKFDEIPGIEDKIYIRLRDADQSPLVSFSIYEKGRETEMHPVYEASDALKAGKLTPIIAPDILPPAQQKHRVQGQFLEGRTWSLISYRTQVYGR